MKITRIDIRGFGAVREQSFRLDGPVTFIYGENEAGKSTLTGFIRAVLFGFASRGQAGERYEPEGGGAFGGSLTLTDEFGRQVLVERFESAGRTKSSAGVVKVTFPDGTTGGEEALRELLGGISADAFRSLFAFGLTELQELRTLQKDEVGGFLYTAGLGVPPSALIDAEKRLTAGMERLYKAQGKKPEINTAMKELAEMEQAIRREKEQVSRYEGWKDQSNLTGERIAAIDADRGFMQAEADWLMTCLKAREPWLRLGTINAELTELPVWDTFPEDAVARWDALLNEEERLTDDWNRLRLKSEELEQRIAAIQNDDHLLNDKPEIEWLLSRIPAYQSDVRSAGEMRAEQEQAGKELKRVLRLIDAEWDEEALERFPVSAAVREQLANHKRRLQETEHEQEKREAEAVELAGRITYIDREIAVLSERLRTESEQRQEDYAVYEAVSEAGHDPAAYFRAIESQYAAVMRLEQEREHAAQRAADERMRLELAQQLDESREREAAGRRMLVWRGVAAGCMALAVWQLADGRFGLAAAVFAAAVAVVGGAEAIAARKKKSLAVPFGSGRKGRQFTGGLKAKRADAEGSAAVQEGKEFSSALVQLEHKLAQAKTALAEQAEPLLTYAETAASSVQGTGIGGAESNSNDAFRILERSLALWTAGCAEWQRRLDRSIALEEKADALRQERSLLEEQAETIAAQLRELGDAHAAAVSAWDGWLAQHGFGLALSPGAVQESLPLMEQGHALLHGQRRLVARFAAAEEAAASFAAAATRLLGDAAAGGDPALGVQRRGEALAQALRRREEAARAEGERREAALEAEALRDRLDALQLRRAELLAQAGADGDAGLRASARLYARRAELEGERRHLLPSLAALVGARRLPELDAALEARSETELAARAAELEECLAEQAREANELRDQRGRLAAELAKLERGEALADKLQRREEQLAALRKLGRDYAVRAFALHLLRKAREVYERERQPGVLLRASDYFARMTRGRYAGVRAPIAEGRKLEAVRPSGQGVDTALLSRGTAEQMYLAMRFALAEAFAPRASLPMIMDDILVNFDEERMRSCLDVLCELADHRQIILFTCHSHVRDAAIEQIPGLQLVDLQIATAR